MNEAKSELPTGKVCDINYLIEMMSGKKTLIKEIMDTFLIQIPEELSFIKTAINKIDFPGVKSYAHTMKSSVSILGVSSLIPILKAMEDLATQGMDMAKIIELNLQLNSICDLAIKEIEIEKFNYA
jgi:HPt (histidine-containing phosphotransfer) domain-containing protein